MANSRKASAKAANSPSLVRHQNRRKNRAAMTKPIATQPERKSAMVQSSSQMKPYSRVPTAPSENAVLKNEKSVVGKRTISKNTNRLFRARRKNAHALHRRSRER